MLGYILSELEPNVRESAHQETLRTIERGKQCADSIESEKLYTELLRVLADQYRDRGEIDQEIEIRQQVIQRQHPSQDSALVSEYQALGSAYSLLADGREKALRSYLNALSLAENAVDKGALADSIRSIRRSVLVLENNFAELFRMNQEDGLRILLDFNDNSLSPWALSDNFQERSRLHSLLGEADAAIWMQRLAIDYANVVRLRMGSLFAADFEEGQSVVNTIFEEKYLRLATLYSNQGRLAEAQMVLDMLKEDEQFDFVRRSANADPRRTRLGYTPTEERWMSRYREIADRLAALGREEQALQKQAKPGLSEEQKKRQAAVAADLKVAQTAFESFLTQMREEFAAKGPARAVEFAESSVKALAELQGLLKSLGDDVVLLQIYLTDEQVNFLLTTPGVQLARNVKIKTQDLNRQVAALNRLLRDPKSEPLPAAQALYKLLLAPVEQDLQQAGAKTVMLSLDGVLRYLPFGVLHDGERYALQRWNLPIYTSVVRERLRDAANPNWHAAGLGVTRKHGDFDPLPAVRAEMSSIIRTGTSGVLPGEVHLDEAFTAQRLKDVSQRRFPVVHVASHFRFSPGTEVNSFLLLGDGTRLTLGDIRTQNYRFDDVDLLTLSACETGLGGGRDQRGREIEGLGVIAQQQGAKAVLATLWKVADSSTATLMGDMYRRRTQFSLSKIEALRQAQIALASQPSTSHPFYWAPFVLMGNWK